MPKKSVRAHGTQAGQQSNTEFYKSISSYKSLITKSDDVNNFLQEIYNNNIWNLQEKFKDLAAYFDDIGVSNIISWNEGIQYLGYEIKPQKREVSLKHF